MFIITIVTVIIVVNLTTAPTPPPTPPPTTPSHKATLHKRGWGRLAELGETYYEHLVADDNVGSVPTLFADRYGATISPGIDQIAETRQTFLGALHKQGRVQG